MSLDFNSQEHSLWIEFKLNNFSLYELELLKMDCQIRIKDHDVARIKESIAYTLKRDEAFSFQSNHQITPGEASRIKEYGPVDGPAFAKFLFKFTVRSRFGIQDVFLPEKLFCVRVRQHYT